VDVEAVLRDGAVSNITNPLANLGGEHFGSCRRGLSKALAESRDLEILATGRKQVGSGSAPPPIETRETNYNFTSVDHLFSFVHVSVTLLRNNNNLQL
jgi:hypothetical protein